MMLLKAVASGLLVFFILRGAGKLGDRASGMVAGLPLASAPALLWLALERDTAVSVATLTDVMVTASAYAAFAVFFLAFAHFLRGGWLLLTAAIASLSMVYLTQVSFVFNEPTAAAIVVCGALLWGARLLQSQAAHLDAIEANRAQPAHAGGGVASRCTALSTTQRHMVTAALAGILVLFLLLLGQSSPRWMAAALVGLPVVSASVLASALASGSHQKTLRTAEGFIDGCLIRACFSFFFALLLPELGVGTAFVSAVALSLALAGSLFWRSRMSTQAQSSSPLPPTLPSRTVELDPRDAFPTTWMRKPR